MTLEGETYRLGELADVSWGDTNTTKSAYETDGYPAFSASGRDGFLPYADFDRTGVVVSAIGANCGKTWLAKGQWSCIKNTMRMWSTSPLLDTEYLYWLSTRSNFFPIRGSAQPFISQGDARALRISLPPISEQKAIAHILGALDDKIELNQKMNQTLEDIAKAIFKSWFVDFDPVRSKAEGRPTGLPAEISALFPDTLVDSESGEVPAGWAISTLGGAFAIQYGKNFPTKNLIENGYPVFGGNGIIGFHSAYLYDEVMTLIACRGAASGKVCRSLPMSFVTNNSLVVNHKGSGLTSQRYIEFFLECGDLENYVTGSAQPQLTIDNIKNLPFMIPPSPVVASFQEIVDPIANRQLGLDKENILLCGLRDTLLPKLISGELRIADAEKFLQDAGI